jgi:hypothetical protein
MDLIVIIVKFGNGKKNYLWMKHVVWQGIVTKWIFTLRVGLILPPKLSHFHLLNKVNVVCKNPLSRLETLSTHMDFNHKMTNATHHKPNFNYKHLAYLVVKSIVVWLYLFATILKVVGENAS